MEIFAPIGDVVYILLLINCYIGNNTTKCHSRSMGDDRRVFHQKVPSLPMVIASDSRYFQSS